MANRFGTAFIGAILMAAIIVVAGAYLGLSRWLGAHPFWMVQVAWIGVGAGVVVALVYAWRQFSVWSSGFFTLAFLGLSFTAAAMGKHAFAASFAADRVAGKFWYHGSMAVAGGMFVCLFVVFYFLGRKLIR